MTLFIKLEDGTHLQANIAAVTGPHGRREITLPEFMELTEKLSSAVTIYAPYSAVTTEAPTPEG